jgi:hypothetical protein
MNVTRESHVKVLGRWVRVPNWFIVDQKWSAEKIAREELRAEQLGDLQKFVTRSPLFPIACVAAFFGFMYVVCWAVPTLVDTLL